MTVQFCTREKEGGVVFDRSCMRTAASLNTLARMHANLRNVVRRQVSAGTVTVLACGPAPAAVIDTLVAGLRLY